VLRRKLANGHYREYTPDQLAIFAENRHHRADVKPKACNGGDLCWVELWPPCWSRSSDGFCVGCYDTPRLRGIGFLAGRTP
jgi:hypothetical protein